MVFVFDEEEVMGGDDEFGGDDDMDLDTVTDDMDEEEDDVE